MRTRLLERPATHLVLPLVDGIVVKGASRGADLVLGGEEAADVVVRAGGSGVRAAVPGVVEGLAHDGVFLEVARLCGKGEEEEVGEGGIVEALM